MSQTNVSDLFATSAAEGMLSPEALQTLTVADIGAQIQEGLGINADDVLASEVVLVSLMPDDSGSIHSIATGEQQMRDGHNQVLEALLDSKQREGILFHTRYLNGTVLCPYQPLEQALRMDKHNYCANKGTPLYDQTVILLGTVLAKTQEFTDNGVPVRTVTLIISDGDDLHSRRHGAADVRSVVESMLKTESHIVAAMGIDDGSTDFRRVFEEMGIRDEWILTPGNTPSEIRTAFQVFSQSAVRASQGAASFSQTALGGFGN